MSELDLQVIKEHLARTFDGEWRKVDNGPLDSSIAVECDACEGSGCHQCDHEGRVDIFFVNRPITYMDDVSFVIKAHNEYIPALIAEVEDLRAELDKWHRAASSAIELANRLENAKHTAKAGPD